MYILKWAVTAAELYTEPHHPISISKFRDFEYSVDVIEDFVFCVVKQSIVLKVKKTFICSPLITL